MLECFKIAFLFIGAMIGAGFATGSELMVFFGEAGLLSVLLSAVICGLFVYFFTCLGGIIKKYRRVKVVIDITIALSSAISVVTMVAAANEIIEMSYGIKYFGTLSGIIVAIISIFSMRITKNINFLLMPLLFGLIFIIAIKSDFALLPNKLLPLNALSYAAMNVLLGGYLIMNETTGKSRKVRIAITTIVTLITCLLMTVVYLLSFAFKNNSMPLYELSKTIGLCKICGIIIYLAILSTLLGAAKVVQQNFIRIIKSNVLAIVFLLALVIIGSAVEFNYMVKTFYPISGQIGVAIMCLLTVMYIYDKFIKVHIPYIMMRYSKPKQAKKNSNIKI